MALALYTPKNIVANTSAPRSRHSTDNVSYLQNVINQSGYIFVSDGRPKDTLPRGHARPSDLPLPPREIQRPASANWSVLLSGAQVWELLEGHVPGRQEKIATKWETEGSSEFGAAPQSPEKEKWFVYSEFEYRDEQPSLKKSAPHTVNGRAKIHFCSRRTGREIFRLDLEIERMDVVALSYPNVLREKFEWDTMIVGIVDKIHWESDEELVNDANEANAKKQVKGLCAAVLDVFLLLKEGGVEPVRMEDRGAMEKVKDTARAKMDLQVAMQGVLSSRMKALAAVGRGDVMATAVKRGLVGRDMTTRMLQQ